MFVPPFGPEALEAYELARKNNWKIIRKEGATQASLEFSGSKGRSKRIIGLDNIKAYAAQEKWKQSQPIVTIRSRREPLPQLSVL